MLASKETDDQALDLEYVDLTERYGLPAKPVVQVSTGTFKHHGKSSPIRSGIGMLPVDYENTPIIPEIAFRDFYTSAFLEKNEIEIPASLSARFANEVRTADYFAVLSEVMRNLHEPIEQTDQKKASLALEQIATEVDVARKPQEAAIAPLESLLRKSGEARDYLLNVARGNVKRPDGRVWSNRVRWFAIETLLDFNPEGYREFLIDQVLSGPETHVLYGAVVAVKYLKHSPEEREALSANLASRLEEKRDTTKWTLNGFSRNLVGQMAATFGSYAKAKDLSLLGDLGLGDYSFEVRMNALDAAHRVASRYVSEGATESFYQKRAREIVTRSIELIGNRHLGEVGGLIWPTLKLLLARLGEESLLIREIVGRFPQIREDVRREVDRAKEYLERIEKVDWLEAQKARISELTHFLE